MTPVGEPVKSCLFYTRADDKVAPSGLPPGVTGLSVTGSLQRPGLEPDTEAPQKCTFAPQRATVVPSELETSLHGDF